MSLPSDLDALLAAGHGVLVPDSTRAASVAIAYGASRIAAGTSVWNTPNIVTPAGWLSQAAADFRQPLMSAATEWMLLRQWARQSATPATGITANSLADAWQRSLHRMRDLDVPLARVRAFGTPESQALATACAWLEKHASEWGVGAPALCSPRALPLPLPRVAIGFATPPRAFLPWLRTAKETGEPSAGPVALHTSTTPAAEVMAAMSWAVEKLTQQPDARVLVVVPAGIAYETALDAALRAMVRLDGSREAAVLLDRRTVLRDAPAVRQQLFLLDLLAGAMPAAECCAGLRGGGASVQERASRAQLAADIATRFSGAVDLDTLVQLAAQPPLASNPAVAQWLNLLLTARNALGPRDGRHVDWPERIVRASLSLPVDWRDGSVDDGYAAQKAWQELLVESAGLNRLRGPVALASALRLLTARAARTPLSVPRADSRLHVARQYHDPVLRYDGIWVCGLAAAQWPPAPQPDPWLPNTLQVEAGDPAASATGRLLEARSQLTAWHRASDELHLSYPGELDDYPASPSPLLHGREAEITDASAAAPQRASRAAQIAAAKPLLTTYVDDRFSRAIEGVARNGAESLNRFNECAFQGSGLQRLLVARRDDALPGLDARDSGGLLHLALERIWSRLGDLQALKRIPESDTQRFVAALVDEVIATRRGAATSAVTSRSASLRVEAQRLTARLVALLDAERQRGPFSIHALEWKSRLELAGVTIDVRLDRIDRIGDRLLILDYKSGKSGLPRLGQDPPREIQLLIYREALRQQGSTPAGMLTWHLLPERIKAGGALDAELDLPAALQPKGGDVDFARGQSQWSSWLQERARELWQGDARLRPLKNACRHCDLTVLCRRLERLGLAATDDSSEDGSDSDGEANGTSG